MVRSGRRASQRLINDDEVEESYHPQKLEEGSSKGPRASVLFYIRRQDR
jgi:hypothetical protein